jgi:Chromate transporter
MKLLPMEIAGAQPATRAAPGTLWQLTAYFLKLGTIGFGGPVALVGYMQRDLVERHHWIDDEEYKLGLALGMRVLEGLPNRWPSCIVLFAYQFGRHYGFSGHRASPWRVAM